MIEAAANAVGEAVAELAVVAVQSIAAVSSTGSDPNRSGAARLGAAPRPMCVERREATDLRDRPRRDYSAVHAPLFETFAAAPGSVGSSHNGLRGLLL